MGTIPRAARAAAQCSALLVSLAVATVLAAPEAGAQTAPAGAREVPAKTVPVPDTVSPQMQKLIAAPLTPTWNVIPKTAEEWKAQVDAGAAATVQTLPALREKLRVKVEPMTIDGVKAYMVTPEIIPPENRNRLLVHVHGGCYVSFPGESGTAEAIFMAGLRALQGDLGRLSHAARSSLSGRARRRDDGVEGGHRRWRRRRTWRSSAPRPAANLTLSMVLRAKQDNLPLPAAIAPGTPMSDLTNAGDTFRTNAMLDNVLVAPDASCDKRAALYANGHDLKDPMLSPVYGDMHGFPPAILTSGTRDLLLEQHRARASQAAPGRRRGGAAGLRGPVARALLPRCRRARDQGGVRGDRPLLRQAPREIALREGYDASLLRNASSAATSFLSPSRSAAICS